MAAISHVETIWADGSNFLRGVTALVQVGSSVYSAGSWGGGISAFAVGPDGLTERDRQTFSNTGNFAQADLVPLTVNGQPSLLHLTPSATAFLSYHLAPDGTLSGGRTTLTVSGGMPDRPLDAAAADGRLYFAQTEGGVAAYARAANGALSYLGQTGGGAVNAVATAEVAGSALVIAAETDGDAVAVYRPTADGLALADRIGAADGLGLNAPSQVQVVSLAGQTFVILGAQQSSTLTVLRLSESGRLTVTDHVTDSLATRFGTMGAMAVAHDDDDAYVAVAGDDGVTILRLLPDGRLVHVASLADEAGFILDDVTALALRLSGSDLFVTTSSATEAGLSSFRVDLSQQGDVLSGDGTEQTGTALDDIFLASAGDDVFRGGLGTDTFVFFGDGSQDRVLDYRAGVDRLDLSSVPLLYSVAQVSLVPTADGAILLFGGLDIRLYSANQQPLSAADILLDTDLNHLPPGNLAGIGRAISGTVGADTLVGSAGDDFFHGLAGDDVILAGSGSDRFDGGPGHDVVSYAQSRQRVLIDLGGMPESLKTSFRDGIAAGHDYRAVEEFLGGTRADWMLGDASANTFRGGGDDDRLEGLGGNDRLDGENGIDLLYGNRGSDTLSGGLGGDVLRGQRDADWLDGGDGADQLLGGAGRDTLTGGLGADRFVIQRLADSATGNDARDRIQDFEAGIDRIDLSRLDSNTAREGDQAFVFIGTGDFSDVRQLRAFQTGGKTIVQGDIDGDGRADFEVELAGLHTLSAVDFIL